MIDWVSFKIPLVHPHIPAGAVLVVDPDGTVKKEVKRRLSVTGSHCSSFSVQSSGSAGEGLASELSFSGNPSKFLQGHNLFGSDDLVSLVSDSCRRIADHLGVSIPAHVYREVIDAGNYPVTCVDINYSFHLANQTDVQAWLRGVEFQSRSRNGRPCNDSGTVYWGKRSRRWAMKAYSKWMELNSGKKDHSLPDELLSTPLMEWAKTVLRVELRLRGQELKELGLTTAKQLQGKAPELFNLYRERIVMNGQMPIRDSKLHELPTKLRATYTLWKQGNILFDNKTKTGMLPKATFYKHRKLLIDFGIDITMPCAPEESSNVIPLIRAIEAKPAQIPDWAFQYGLVHRSAVNH